MKLVDELIKEAGRREKAELALRTIYENARRQPRDMFVHGILTTIEGILPDIREEINESL